MSTACWPSFFFGAIFGAGAVVSAQLVLVLVVVVWLARRGHRLQAQQGQERMRQAAERAAAMGQPAAQGKES